MALVFDFPRTEPRWGRSEPIKWPSTSDAFKYYLPVLRRVFGPQGVYVQMENRYRRNQILRSQPHLLLGTEGQLARALSCSEDSKKPNTARIERFDLFKRRSCSYLHRSTPGAVRNPKRLDDALEVLRLCYNFIRPHSSLRFGKVTRTPAMQAGIFWPAADVPADLHLDRPAAPTASESCGVPMSESMHPQLRQHAPVRQSANRWPLQVGQMKIMLLVIATALSCVTWQPAIPNPTSDTLDMTPGRHAISATYCYEVATTSRGRRVAIGATIGGAFQELGSCTVRWPFCVGRACLYALSEIDGGITYVHSGDSVGAGKPRGLYRFSPQGGDTLIDERAMPLLSFSFAATRQPQDAILYLKAGTADALEQPVVMVRAWPGPEVDLSAFVAPLLLLAAAGDTANARKAIEGGADIDGKEPMLGLTPLQVAVAGGHVEMIHMLIAMGADVSIDNNFAMTPLHVASICAEDADDMARIEVIEALLQAGASRAATDISVAMPIAYARSRRARALLKP